MRNDLITSIRQHALARRQIAVQGHGTSWTTRRRVIAILRSAFRVIGMGRQRSVGMLGGASLGAAIGVLSFLATSGQATAQSFSSNNANGSPAASATGANATAGGYGASASGSFSTVLGNDATDHGFAQTVTLGATASNGGLNAIAIGFGTTTTGAYAIAQGFGASAGANAPTPSNQPQGGIAIGTGAIAGANTAGTTLAIGNNAVATAPTASSAGDSVAIGTQTLANNVDSIAIGAQTTASGTNTIAIGNNFTSNAGNNTTVIGVAATASTAATNSVVLGNNASASANSQTVLGQGASAAAVGGVALGGGSMQVRNGLAGGAENFSGTAVASTNGSVSVGSAGNERQITNVAGGTQATDAVNVRQLQVVGGNLAGSLGGGATFNPTSGAYTAPIFTVAGTNYTNVGSALNAITGGSTSAGAKYFHANSTGADSVATVANSIAIGPGSTSYNTGDFAAGLNTTAGTSGSVYTNDTAVGAGSQATGSGSLALGMNATATGNGNSTAIGANASTTGNQGLAIGASANAGAGTSSLAIGSSATVNGNGSTAIGGNSKATGIKALAIGDASQALASNAVSIGRNTTANANGDIAIGQVAVANGVNGTGSAVAIGSGNIATGAGAVAIGDPSVANGTGAFAGGFNSNATADGTATGGAANGAVAIGNASIAYGQGSVALGNTSTTGGAGAIAIGDTANAAATKGIALGSGSTATNANDVALGSASTTAAAVATTGTTIGGTAYTFAGTTPGSTVSVGAAGAERTITNVAAGRLSGTSTDAINGSELYATNTQVTANATAINGLAGGTTGPIQRGAAANVLTATAPGGTAANPGTAQTLANIAAGQVATGSTQAVNGGQLYGTANSVATALGGGSAVTAAGTVSAPAYMVGGQTYNNVGGALTAITGGSTTAGVKYFHANSTGPDSAATGADAIAVGVNVTAAGANSVAVGGDATAANAANAAGQQSVAIGDMAKSTGAYGTAVGSNASAQMQGSALGEGASAAAISVAAGFGSTASGANATAVGATTTASGQYSLAAGMSASAIGVSSTALGNDARAVGTQSVAIGGSGGTGSANAAQALANSGVAIGAKSMAANVGDVALGANSTTAAAIATTGATIGGTAYTFAGTTPASTVSVGATGAERTITNVAAGRLNAGSTDAINGSQLYATNSAINNNTTNITALGTTTASTLAGGAAYNPTSGITGFNPMVAGGTQTTVGGALSALDTATRTQGAGLTAALGGGAAVSPNGTVTAPIFAVGAGTYSTVAGAVGALQTGAPVQYATAAAPTTANGYNASQNETLVGAGAGPVTLSNVGPGTLSANSTQAVNGSQLYATNTQVTNNTTAITNASNGLTGPIQRGATTNLLTATATGGTAAAPGAAQTLTNIAAGGLTAASTDAVNGSQLYGTNQNVAALTNGTAGLVQQDPASRAITVGAGTNGTTVGFANNAGTARTLTGVAPGQVASGSTQAINGGQLFGTAGTVATAFGGGSAVNPDGTLTAPAYMVGGQTYNNVGSALTASNGLAVQYTPNANGVATNAVDLTKGGTLAPVALTGLAAGALNATSADAVNGSQLYATNQTVAANTAGVGTLGMTTASTLGSGATYNPATGITGFSSMVAGATQTNVGGALSALNTAAQTQGSGLTSALGGGAAVSPNGTVTAPVFMVGAGNYGTVSGALGALQTGAPVQYATAAAPTTANGFNASQNETLVGAAAGPVTLSNVGPGTLSTTSTQAVNGSQLYATNTQVTNNTNAINNATNGVSGPIQRGTTANLLTATATGGTAAAPGAAQTLTNIAAGALAPASTDAVNGSQLYATNQTVTALANGTGGLVQQDPTTHAITVGGSTNGTTVGFANNAGTARTLTGIAPGQVAAASTQAINGGQLYGTAGSVATALGGGSTVNPDGTLSAPTYTVGGQTYNNAGSALTASNGLAVQYTPSATGAATSAVDLTKGGTLAPVALTGLAAGATTATSMDAVNGSQLFATNTQVTNNTNAITNATNGLTGPIQRGATANLLTATATGGTAAAPGAAQTLTNIAAGGLAPTSTDAVNGSQLYATNQAVANTNAGASTLGTTTASTLGGGATYNPATGITGFSPTVAGGTQTSVGGALTALDTAARMQGTGLASALGGGAAVSPNGTVTAPVFMVGAGNYGTVAGALGALQTVAPVQYATAAAPTTANGFNTSQNETLVGAAAGPVTLSNVGPGTLSSTSTQAVNGSQLFATNSQVTNNTTAIGNAASGLTGPIQRGATANLLTATATGGTAAAPGAAQTLTNIAAGGLSATSTDAVNGSQLFATNQTINALAGGTGGLVQQDPTSRAITVGAGTNGTSVGFANNAGTARTLTGVAPGLVAAGSTQAVNGGQLSGTAGSVATALGGGSTVNPDGTLSAPAYTVGGQTYNSIGGALAASNGLDVQYTPNATGAATSAIDLTKGGTLAPVALTGLAAGAVTATSADAVNGSQLFATNMQIANNNAGAATLGMTTASTLGGGATYNPATGITGFSPTVAGATQTSVGGALSALDMAARTQGSGLASALGGGASVASNGTVTAPAYTVGTGTYGTVGGALGALQTGAAVQYATAAAPTTANGLIPSQNATLVGAAAGPVTLSNVASGTLSGTSTQAVNGSQLYATNQSVAALTSGAAGLVQQATPTSQITIGANTGGTSVNVAGTAGPRLLTGLRTGTIDPNSTDAVNGQQLYGTAQSVAAALGGGSTVGANGALTAPTYGVQGASYNSVGGAVGAIDGNLTTLNAAISGGGGIKYFHGNSTLADSQAVGINSIAIGPQAVATNAGDVALGQGSTTGTTVATTGATIAGTTYGFAGAAPTSTVSVGAVGAERTITNVAAGSLSGTSTDAVNGSQLYATNQAVNGLGATSAQLGASTAASLGGGAAYDPTSGKLTAPSYTVGQMAYNDVGGAVGALQSGSPLQYSTSSAPTAANGYVPSQDVTLVGASAGPVILHNVGAGVAATDAANVGQLPGAFTSPTSNTFAFAQAGGSGAPVTVANVAAGLVSATSTQAVNGSQLYGLAQSTSAGLNNLAQGFGQLQQEVASNDRRASAGTAVALAATGLHYDDRPGKFSVGAATAVYRGQVGVSAGLAHTSEDGRWRVNAAASFAPTDNKADVGAVVGASYSFN